MLDATLTFANKLLRSMLISPYTNDSTGVPICCRPALSSKTKLPPTTDSRGIITIVSKLFSNNKRLPPMYDKLGMTNSVNELEYSISMSFDTKVNRGRSTLVSAGSTLNSSDPDILVRRGNDASVSIVF